MKQRKINFTSVFIFLSFFVLFIISISTPIVDNDTLFHLKIGEWVVENKQVPTKDMFSMHDLNYTAYAYLFDIVVYLFYVVFGIQGMVVFKYLFWIFFALMATILVQKLSSNKKFIEIFFWIFIIILNIAFYNIRPAMASYFILFLQLYIMNKWAQNQDSKIIYWIPLTFLILNNLHGGVFLFHLFMVCSFGLELFVGMENNKIKFKNFFKDKNFYKCLLVMILSIISLFLTPNGTRIANFSIGTVAIGVVKYNFEWLPSSLSSVSIYIFLIILFIKFVDFKKMPITNLVNLIVAFILSINTYRFVPYIGISLILLIPYTSFSNMPLPYIPDIIKNIFNKKSNQLLFSMTGFISVLFIFVLAVGSNQISLLWDWENKNNSIDNPVQAVEYMKENNITTNLYNHYNIGGYLLFKDIDVFIDSRADLYSKYINEFENDISIIDDYLDASYEGEKPFKYLMDKYNLEYAILIESEFHLLDDLDNYEVLYEDEESKVIQYIRETTD